MITRKIPFVLPLLLFASLLNAQKKPAHFLEIKGGLSAPVGDFANKIYQGRYPDQANGLAKAGFGAALTAGYRFSKTLANVLTIGYSRNKQDASPFEAYLKEQFGSNTATSIQTNAWQVFKIMDGGYFETPFSSSSDFSFRAHLQVGACKTGIPAFKYTYLTNAFPPQAGSIIMAKINLPWAICYDVGAGMKYRLNNKVFLMADGSYFNSSPVYKYVYPQNPPNPVPLISAEKKISLASLQVLAGIGIQF